MNMNSREYDKDQEVYSRSYAAFNPLYDNRPFSTSTPGTGMTDDLEGERKVFKILLYLLGDEWLGITGSLKLKKADFN